MSVQAFCIYSLVFNAIIKILNAFIIIIIIIKDGEQATLSLKHSICLILATLEYEPTQL